MLKLHNFLFLFLYVCECISHSEGIPCRGTATYKLQFQPEWTDTSARPAGAGFSGFIGCTHNKCYQMWRIGARASLGVKNVAENGDRRELYDEIQRHIEKWKTASNLLQTNNNTIGPEEQVIFPQVNRQKSGFIVDNSRALVSVIARITPSPDLFVGIHDVNLCNKTGKWISEKLIRLFPYDAGTAKQSSLNNSLIETISPPQAIRLAENGIISHSGPIGFIRFKLVHASIDGSSKVVIDEDNCPNRASLEKLSSLVWFAVIMTIIGCC